MPQIQVGFRAVLGDKDLAVLDGVHGAGIDIDVGVELLHGDPKAPGFQEPSERGGGDPFSQSRDDPACDKHIFYAHNYSFCFLRKTAADAASLAVRFIAAKKAL